MQFIHIKGKNMGHILMFTLSTCAWCKKTKRFLNELGIDYYYIDVDLLEGKEKRQAERELHTWNPLGSFPTIVINNEHTIVGYSEDEIIEKIKD
ncbi:glutaredoxin family protein [Candidatus Latescibacterota bacterium]